MEEKLWDFIDGNLDQKESDLLKAELSSNVELNALYLELLNLHQSFNKIEIDEPSMSFTRNVMDKVQQENALKPLKTKVNKYIIYSAFGLCLSCLCIVLVYATELNNLILKDFDFKLDFSIMNQTKFLYLIIFIYSALGLVLVDLLFRNKLKYK